jgi:hypothetical protein
VTQPARDSTPSAKTAGDSMPLTTSAGDSARHAPAPRRPPKAKRPPVRETAPPPAPPVAKVGFVTINAVPYGTVSIDGVEVGDTPIVRRQLPPGDHLIRIVRPGFRTEDVKVSVTADNEVRVSRSLIRDGT